MRRFGDQTTLVCWKLWWSLGVHGVFGHPAATNSGKFGELQIGPSDGCPKG
jgi:hypothetical protein